MNAISKELSNGRKLIQKSVTKVVIFGRLRLFCPAFWWYLDSITICAQGSGFLVTFSPAEKSSKQDVLSIRTQARRVIERQSHE